MYMYILYGVRLPSISVDICTSTCRSLGRLLGRPAALSQEVISHSSVANLMVLMVGFWTGGEDASC